MTKKKAPESRRVKRARHKLEKQISDESKRITPQALEKVLKTINHWISRHAKERLDLKSKRLTLFDENKDSAPPTSRLVFELQKRLAKELSEEAEKAEDLRGRVQVQKSS